MPPPEIVTGGLPELEDALIDAVVRAREGDPLAPLTVLVGHVLLRPYLRRMLASRGVPQLNVRFVQPHELAEELALGRVDASKPRLTPQAERLIVREVAEGASAYFAAVAGRSGFTDALARLFRDIELGGFTPDGFDASVARAATDGGPGGDKLRELARLYRVYVGRRAGFTCPSDLYAAADASRFEGPLLVYGFWEKPRQVALRLIEEISAIAPTTVFLPRSGLDPGDATASMRQMLVDLGASVRDLQRSDPTSPLDRLNCTLFTGASEPEAPSEQISLVSAPDTVREVWEAARACLRWAEDGLRFHEMAVVYRNRDPYAALTDEIFREAGIETYLHDGRLLAGHPLGRRLLALILLAGDASFPRASVMAFLTETRVSKEIYDAYGFRPSEWETYTREAGVVDDVEQWDKRLERLAGEKREIAKLEGLEWQEEQAGRTDALRQFAREFHTALTSHADIATWEDHLRFVRDLAAKYATGTEPLLEALGDLATLSAVAEKVSFETFCRAVRDDLESRDASRVLGEPVREFGKRGVAVLDATSLRHLRFRAVYMLGAAERAWPRPLRPDPLVLEHERRAINEAGHGVLPLRTEPDSEPLTFSLGVQAPTERLRVSYARAEAGGSGKHLPSFFFRAVVDTLEGRRVPIADVESSAHVRRLSAGRLAADSPGDSLSQAEYDRGLIRQSLDGAEPAAIKALELDTPSFGRAIAARTGRWSASLTAYDGVMIGVDALAAALTKSGFANGAAMSPSRLEMYATCPYRYFLRYTLGLEPVEEPEAIDRIDALERGSLIHEILERFLRAIGRDDPPSGARRDAHLETLLEIAREEEQSRQARGVTGRPLIWAMDRKQIEEDLVRWYDVEIKDQSGMLPGAFEASFGPIRYGLGAEDESHSTKEPLHIRAGGRDLLFQGRIDRIDWDAAAERFRVIDYKTGSLREKETFDKGRALQLPIYLLAAARALKLEPEAGEAQYFYVSSKGGFKRRAMTGDNLVASEQQFHQVLNTIADGVDGGMFAPNPDKDKWNCKWCDFNDICDSRIDTIAERKKGDARQAAYVALEEIK